MAAYRAEGRDADRRRHVARVSSTWITRWRAANCRARVAPNSGGASRWPYAAQRFDRAIATPLGTSRLAVPMGKKPRIAFDSTAPEEWLAGASSAARLYRRLLDAIKSGDAAVQEARRDDIATEQLMTAMNELRSQATAITEHLVVVSRLPFAKRQNGFRPLRAQVDEVERLAVRVGVSAAHARGHKEISEGLNGVAARLDSLDQARRDAEGDLPEEARTRLRRSIDAMRRRRA